MIKIKLSKNPCQRGYQERIREEGRNVESRRTGSSRTWNGSTFSAEVEMVVEVNHGVSVGARVMGGLNYL